MESPIFVIYEGEDPEELLEDYFEARTERALDLWEKLTDEQRRGTGFTHSSDFAEMCTFLERRCDEELVSLNCIEPRFKRDLEYDKWLARWFIFVSDEDLEDDSIEDEVYEILSSVGQHEYTCEGGCSNECFGKEWNSEIHPEPPLCLLKGGMPRGRRKGRRRNFKKRRGKGNFKTNIIPRITVKPKQTRQIPYYVTSGVDEGPITCRCLLNLCLSGVNTSTAATNLYESVRIKWIELFYAPDPDNSIGNSTEHVVLSWKGNRSPDTRVVARGTLSMPARIKMRPPKESMAAFWANNTGNLDDLLCLVTVPTNGFIIISIECVIGDGATRTCVIVDPGLTGVGYAALDNAIVAGTVGQERIQPDGLTYFNMTTP